MGGNVVNKVGDGSVGCPQNKKFDPVETRKKKTNVAPYSTIQWEGEGCPHHPSPLPPRGSLTFKEACVIFLVMCIPIMFLFLLCLSLWQSFCNLNILQLKKIGMCFSSVTNAMPAIPLSETNTTEADQQLLEGRILPLPWQNIGGNI